MDAQFQIRQNAMEMQEYMKELFDWQKTIQKKDKAIRKTDATDGTTSTKPPPATASSSSGVGGAGGSSAPAPRGRAAGNVPAAPAALQAPGINPRAPHAPSASASSSASAATGQLLPAVTSSGAAVTAAAKMGGKRKGRSKLASTAASHTYAAYAKWDKFDIDAALQSGSEGEGSDGEEEEEEEEGVVVQQQPQQPPQQQQQQGPVQGAGSRAPQGVSGGPLVRAPGEEADLSVRSTKRTADPTPTPSAPQPGSAAAAGTAAAGAAGSAQGERELPPIRNQEPQTADAWRARGNDLFKIGQWSSALECYTQSLLLEPTCLAYANRAMARLKLKQWEEAEEDCTRAIALDRAYIKAYHRRGSTRRQLGRLLEAVEDFEFALRLEPANAAVRAERDGALKELMEAEGLKHTTKRVAVPVRVIQATAGSTAGAVSGAAARAAGGAGSGVSSSVGPGSGGAAAASAMASAAVAQGGAETAVQVSAPAKASTAAAGASAASTAAATAAAAAAAAAAAVAAAQSVMRPPKTSTEFESSWRAIGDDRAQQAAYLRLLEGEQLPSVFKSSLTPQVLLSLVRAILLDMADASYQAQAQATESVGASGSVGCGSSVERGVQLLVGLTKVARFDMTAMCIPSKDREGLRELWDRAKGGVGDAAASAALEGVRKKLRV